MKEFAQKRFQNASTDVIVKQAAISKGALFHYFNNKKHLFLFLYDYTLNILESEILIKFNPDEKDYFERIRQVTILKIDLLKKHPEMYDFLAAAYMEESGEVKSELESRNKELAAYGRGKLYEGIDTSKFKEGIDAKKAIDIVTWTIDGYSNKEMGRVKNYALYEQNFHQVFNELDIYLEMLKKSFYR